MIIAFEELRNLDDKLSQYKDKGILVDYRIVLKLNMTANLYIVSNPINNDYINKLVSSNKVTINTEYLTEEEFNIDEYYKSLFYSTKTLDFGLRRTLTNVLDGENGVKLESCPIVSFYSFKGGVGRTTALALFASFYSIIHSKKVFVIDCDFEAPGLINFYGIKNEDIPKNGIVEYIKDKEANIQCSLRDDYVYEISKKYSGDGQIYLLSAGNIFDSADRLDYIEALSRVDLYSSTVVTDQFCDIINDINREYNPDVILIDSRTGFNDIFGIVGNKLSDIVVGFFGNNAQNRPGLHFFLETLLNNKRNINLILVLSIISSSFNKELSSFRDKVFEHIQTSMEGELDSMPALPVFYLSRYPSLERIGTEEEDPEDFVTIIERRMLSDYQDLFDKLSDQIFTSKFDQAQEACPIIPCESEELRSEPISATSDDMSQLKFSILRKVIDNFPEAYAENVNFSDNFLNAQFYFRRCMEDVFNQDKFLLLGGKGTGKTFFYQALREPSFFINLQKRSQKEHLKYKVINVISLPNESGVKNKFIDIAARFRLSEIKDEEFFYRRFWEVFIWNSIRLEDQYTGFASNLDFEVRPIYDDDTTARYLKNYMDDDGYFSKIEQELYDIDTYFKINDLYGLILFDQLDRMVKPNLWAKAIAPLIRYNQSMNFSRLFPKLFLRRDLFNKLGNLTNKESLKLQSIDLEWSKEELFAFFLKIVFAYSKQDFINYCYLVRMISNSKLKEINRRIDRINSYNQLPPEEYLIKPLVEIFFGKNADVEGKYGEMYDWIHRNLRNADGTISLRPFLDLVKYAIEKQYERPELNDTSCPILSRQCFNADVRAKAVERHFKDLADEEGNENLRIIMHDIKDDKVPKDLKQSSLIQDDFEKLLLSVIQRHEELKNENLIELEEALKLNGIIFVRHVAGGKKRYSFAYLYKYYLGLRTPKKRYSRFRDSK